MACKMRDGFYMVFGVIFESPFVCKKEELESVCIFED